MKLKFFTFLSILAFSQMTFALSDNLLDPFPVVGSPAEKLDIAELLYYQNTRTAKQCADAQAEADASLKTFFGGPHGLLSAEELAQAKSTFTWLTIKTGAAILYYKTKFGRERPYDVHPEIKPCIELEGSKSYPSGHTTLARVYARVLAEMYPERAFLFMKRADEASMNRVIGGVHHPSDIVAGRKLGNAIADEYIEFHEYFSNDEEFSLGLE